MSTRHISLAGSDVGFDCAAGQDVLDAALRAGIELSYSCRKGVCGNCAAPVVTGEVGRAGSVALTNDATPAGQVLLCAATPLTDLTIAPAHWSRLDPSARKRFTAKVFRNEALAPDVTLLQLRLAAGQRAKFRAGQYLRVLLSDGDSRCYSMANAPHESDSVTLHVRRLPGGRFSDGVLPTLQKGMTLDIELPYGSVALESESGSASGPARPVVFVAGGTGFAPVKSLLDDFARRKVARPVTLIWAARGPSGLYLLPALAPWRRQLPGFRFVPALSDEPVERLPGDPDTPVFAGRADQALAASIDDLTGWDVYCCGSPPMVDAVRVVALARRLAPANFHADVFVDSAV
ncbi:MAG TPA: 2Fe-2S iron-sulfur cluster-binding protein [Burkholderiaceae bacterium]|mgnify:CR=1 FL=1|nr:2Fe-2S iron-sulfur cluster-binding protein [Burkholderiaceae bacterium]